MRLSILLLAACLPVAAAPVPVIFDTDMGNDIDDAVALAVIHALESRGEARLIAVTITKGNPQAAVFVDLVNTFYGRGHIPVGLAANGKTPELTPMLRVPAEMKRPDGRALYPRRIKGDGDVPEAAGLLRRVLAEQEDGSVVIVQVGFSTNLARLLDTPGDEASPLGGRELAARKVRLLSIMAGQFPEGKPEYNVRIDVPAAKKVCDEWPGPVVFSGFEVGDAIRYPAVSIERDFSWTDAHPVADAYRAYARMPYDRPMWDPTAMLYAVRPDRGYFGLSQAGKVEVSGGGRTSLVPAAGGKHRYLIADEAQRARVLETLVALTSQPRGGVEQRSMVFKRAGRCEIRAEICRPAGAGTRPVLLWIHGGALISGSRTQLIESRRSHLERYLAAGFTVVSIDYRLAPETKLPEILEDVKDAYQWIRDRGPEAFGADPERIAVAGHSAGGYLSLMCGVMLKPPPKAIASYYGYGDIDGPWYSQPSPHYLKQPPVPEAEAWAATGKEELSDPGPANQRMRFYLFARQQGKWPLFVAGRGEGLDPYCPVRNVRPGYPPTILLHGDADTDVPWELSRDMAGALKGAGVVHRLIVMPGKGHGFDGAVSDPAVSGAVDAAVRFLAERVR